MKKEVCEKLKALRKKHRISQVDIAEELGISQNAYSLMESGRTRIYIDRLIKIAALYNISVNFFFEETK